MDGIFQAAAKLISEMLAWVRERRWIRRIAITLLVVVTLYGLGGFLGVPYLLRGVLTNQVAATLHRPVTVGLIRFNPYRLRLDVDRLHVGDRDPQRPFVDLGHLRVKVSWTSIVRLAPVVGQLTVTQPRVYLVRTGDQAFNFSDLLGPANQPSPPAGKLPRFAVSNIELADGAIYLDDQVLAQRHTVVHIRLGVPFVANMPGDVDIFVQPLLRMVIDGSMFWLDGKAKPFVNTQETVVDLSLHRFELPRYFAYVPVKLPIKLLKGTLSTVLHLHFINDHNQPHINLEGGAALDGVDIHDAADAPLLSLGHLVTTLDEVKPLESIVRLRRIYIEGLSTHLARNADGTTTLTPLTASAASTPIAARPAGAPTTAVQPTPSPTPTARATPGPLAAQMQLAAPSPTPSSAPTPAKATLDFTLGSFELTDSAVEVTDRSQPTPAVLTLKAIHAKLEHLRTIGEGVAPFELTANFGGGGAMAVKGGLDLTQHRVTTDASLNQIDLPALKGFAAPFLNGDLAAGKLTATASVKTDFAANAFNVHVEPASATIDNLDLRGAVANEGPVGWGKFAVTVGQVDLASHQATVNEMRTDGLKLFVKRDRQGQLNLLGLIRGTPQAAATPAPLAKRVPRSTRASHRATRFVRATRSAPPAAGGSAPQWHYRIASVVLDKAEIHSVDEHGAKPVKIDIVPLGLNLKDISDDLTKPITLELDGVVGGKGTFKLDGTAAPNPLVAKIHVATKRLDLTTINSYLGDQVNATIAAASLTMNGQVTATNRHDHLNAAYRGDVTLGAVRILDKLTRDRFLSWGSFSASRVAADYGGAKPKVRIGGLTLSNFYSRIILNSNGKLNLTDITSGPQQAPKSLTRANLAAAATPTPTPTPTPAVGTAPPAPAPKPLPADVAIEGVTLQGGHVNYTDNFIQPHYSADLTEIVGTIGAFSTASTTPADVVVNAQVNSAPLNIKGSVNPLTPMAYVNIGAKADGIDLPGLSPYSTKYTGYPIVKGALTVDVHYLLENQNLTATNHIVIDQLTFGDKVESKDAINLPIRLAVALLKDSRGVIDVTIPVSGSLNNPQFSIGGAVWAVIKNLLLKAATAPFSLIASAFSGGGGGEELNYVEFTPGYAELTPDDLKRLDTVAKALTARPALRLDIAGRVDPRVDQDGLRLAKVDHAVLERKIKAEGESENGAAPPLTPDEYNKYLTKVYKAAKLDKPRDFLGLPKSLPPDEMKKLLATNEKVTDEDLHHLADARASAVRAALSKSIDPARLFILPPKLNADDVKDKDKTTRADLSLS
jgi:hypothetical protein